MSPREAAEYIGCHPRYVRNLINSKRLRATKIKQHYGYAWDVSEEAADEFKNRPRTDLRGYPMGRKRT